MFDSFFHNTFLHFDVLENGLAQSFLSQKPRRTSQKNQPANALVHSLQSYHCICITSANPQSLNLEDDVKRTSERRRFLKVCIFKRDGSQFFFHGLQLNCSQNPFFFEFSHNLQYSYQSRLEKCYNCNWGIIFSEVLPAAFFENNDPAKISNLVFKS